MRLQTPALAVILLLAAGAPACGGAEAPDGDAAPPTPTPAPAVPLASTADLAALLPALEGWHRGEVTSGRISVPAPAASARATYVRATARLDLDIADTGGAPEHLDATLRLAGTDTLQEAANGYLRGTTFNGYPALESWNHVDRIAEVTIIVDKRFIVYATATGLDDLNSLRTILDKVDLAAVARLK